MKSIAGGLAALMLTVLTSACTTADAIDTAGDPQLPSEMSFMPSSRDQAVAEAGSSEIDAMATGSVASAVSLQSYAGATPTQPLAERFGEGVVAARSPELDRLIAAYADHYDVPEPLVRRVVKRESNFNPGARNGPYWGLMQIRHDTAGTMGYRGPASGLLDAETNLNYAVRYLRGAYLTAGGNQDLAVRYYASGYYYDAKRKGLLDETGLGKDRRRKR